ncbi:MAG: AAA family ATPase [Actinobacteria bacterium]|nr:AAA family ATPase [Actinomycetota bacterium]
MKIILLISENREITDNITKYKPENLDLVIIKKEKYLRHYLEEYLPDYVIVDINLDNNDILNSYIDINPKATVILINYKESYNSNPKFITLNKINNKNNIREIINIISKIENEKNINYKNSYKLINQQIISVYSLKGGTGKTTISFNIAYFLKKILNAKVLLIDLNFADGISDLSAYLKTNQIPNLNYYIENYKDGEDALQKSLILKDPEDLDVLLPPLSIAQSNKFNLILLNSLIDLVKGFYNFIVIDLPDDFTELTTEAINLSDSLIIISLPDKTCALKLSKYKFKNNSFKLQNKISILNNPYNFSTISKDEFEKISKFPVLLEIPYFEYKNKNFFNFRNKQTEVINIEYEIRQLINKYILP